MDSALESQTDRFPLAAVCVAFTAIAGVTNFPLQLLDVDGNICQTRLSTTIVPSILLRTERLLSQLQEHPLNRTRTFARIRKLRIRLPAERTQTPEVADARCDKDYCGRAFGVPNSATRSGPDIDTLTRTADSFEAMTARERAILDWVALGKTDFEIGSILRISPKTVNFHVENLKRKLYASTRAQAVILAAQLGLLTAHGKRPRSELDKV